MIVGCSLNDEDKILDLIKSYKTELYQVDYNKQVDLGMLVENASDTYGKYFTEKEFESFMLNRILTKYYEISFGNKCSISFKDIKIEKYFEEKKENKIGYHYVMQVLKTYPESGKEEVVTEEGSISLVKDNNQWRIYSEIITKFPI